MIRLCVSVCVWISLLVLHATGDGFNHYVTHFFKLSAVESMVSGVLADPAAHSLKGVAICSCIYTCCKSADIADLEWTYSGLKQLNSS